MKSCGLEREYKKACLDYHKALKSHEQVQMQFIRSQRKLEEASRQKRSVLSQMAGKKAVPPVAATATRKSPKPSTTSSKGSGQRLGGSGSNTGTKASSRLVITPPRKYKVGERLRKKFHGKFYEGTITALPKPQKFFYHVSYDDGDEEDISVCKMQNYIIEHVIEEEQEAPPAAPAPAKNHAPKRPVASIDIEPKSEDDDDSTMTGLGDNSSINSGSSMERQVAALPRRKKPKCVQAPSPLELLVTVEDKDKKAVSSTTSTTSTTATTNQHEKIEAKVSSSVSSSNYTGIESPPGIDRRATNDA